jgi:hypothetical protein
MKYVGAALTLAPRKQRRRHYFSHQPMIIDGVEIGIINESTGEAYQRALFILTWNLKSRTLCSRTAQEQRQYLIPIQREAL